MLLNMSNPPSVSSIYWKVIFISIVYTFLFELFVTIVCKFYNIIVRKVQHSNIISNCMDAYSRDIYKRHIQTF